MSVTELDTRTSPDLIDLRDLAPSPLVAVPDPVAPDVAPLAPLDLEVTSTYVRWVKPVIDRVGAAVLLVAFLPALVLVAIGIRCTMGPGVVFRQARIGRDGRHFEVYKFRTMRPERRASVVAVDGEDRRRNHKSDADPRHTPLGRFLRKWSIDELPQLLNVLRGEMSLVGPRPELVHIVGRYQPWEHARHAVRPGLTGLWQTRARAQGPTHLFTNMDIDYIRSVSFVTDLRILLATLPAALGAQKGR